jgi:rfaE bifunctional protein kinase chain/domain
MKLGNKEELLSALDLIASTPILVAGDVILDRYVWGKVERISPEAPVPVVEVVRMEDRLGGAANVVRNLAAIGAKPVMCGVVGDDADGQAVLKLLDESGAERSGMLVDGSRPTVLKTRVIGQHQQIVRIDHENRESLAGAVSTALSRSINDRIDASKAVIISDYGKSTISEDVLSMLSTAYASGRLGLKTRPLFVDPHPRNYERYRCMSVAKPNRKEAEVASGRAIESIEDAFRAAEILIKKWNSELMVVTLGEWGMVLRQAGSSDGLHLETAAREVFDVSGAGDTVTALFTSALAVGATPVTAGVLANIAAGIVVSEIGTAAIDLQRLRAEVSEWSM